MKRLLIALLSLLLLAGSAPAQVSFIKGSITLP